MTPDGSEALKGLTTLEACTDPLSEDPDLRGRTYAIAFSTVWDAMVALTDRGLRGWRIASEDADEGVIVAEVNGSILRVRSRVEILIGLDDNAQTRVDVRVWGERRPNEGVADPRAEWLPHRMFGLHKRRISRLLHLLDRALVADPRHILDTRLAAQFGDPDPAVRG